MISWSCIYDIKTNIFDIHIDIMYDITYDIMALHLWYQDHMISQLYDVRAHITNFMCILSLCNIREIKYMMTRWLYTPPKMCCIECCLSWALHFQVHDVQNRPWWSSALLDDSEELLVLIVNNNLMLADATWAFSCNLKLIQLAAWLDNLLPWCCMQGCHSWSWTHSLQEFMNQLGTPTGFRVTYNVDTTGIPAEHTQ